MICWDEAKANFAFCLACIALAFAMGCGGSRLDSATRSLEILREGQATAVDLLRIGLRHALDTRCGGLESEQERRLCADGLAGQWRATEAGMATNAALLEAATLVVYEWARRAQAEQADEDVPPLNVCAAFEDLVEVVHAWSDVAGVEIPLTFRCEGE